MFFYGLVDIARLKHSIPSRTRPLSTVAPMVLRLKTWESRSLPDLIRTNFVCSFNISSSAGWSSPVARQAHNLKVVGSNPTPATKTMILLRFLRAKWAYFRKIAMLGKMSVSLVFVALLVLFFE